MTPPTYTNRFYLKHQTGARNSARQVVPLLLDWLHPASVIDIGCGTGTWLSVFREQGVEDVFGLDGEWVDTSRLDIPADRFRACDLKQPFAAGRKYDVAMSLEVAEHLPADKAETFVDTLTGLSRVVLFSAAIPGQGGTHHVNEQWPEYWAALFARRGYRAVDCLRKRIWLNEQVDWYYAQNALLFVHEDALVAHPVLQAELAATSPAQLSLVHPRRFVEAIELMGRLQLAAADIASIVPPGERFILADLDQYRALLTAGSRAAPFMEREGVYWGEPENDEAALRELERQRAAGARCMVFLWPAFWCLDHYAAFAHRLRSDFRCIMENERVIGFDLGKKES